MDKLNLPIEIDLWAAWYSAYGTWDTTINFWLTATFAVIVAAHTLSSSMTHKLAKLLASLYGAFCLYTFLRGASLYIEGANMSALMMAHGIQFSVSGAILNFLSNIVIAVIFVLGSVGAIRFILATRLDESER